MSTSSRVFIALGTSSQVPTRERNHNGYFLRWDGFGLLFDPGDGTQRQMIFANVSASSITHILITHFHGDHCLGLAGIVQRLSLDRVQHRVHIFYPATGQTYFDNLRNVRSTTTPRASRRSSSAARASRSSWTPLSATARALHEGDSIEVPRRIGLP